MTHLGLPTSKSTQTIEFPINGGEETAAVFAENVVIVPSSGDHINGSSKVKLSNIVDYSWEEKFYPGQLLAVHMSGNYIAYSIKGANFAVRVVNRESAKRALIKGIGAMVEDLAFAFIPTQITLACVDESGAVYIHNIYEDAREITTNLLLHILQMTEVSVPRRVFWCPYIPDETDDLQSQDPYTDETSLLLAVTRDNKIEIWNVASVASISTGPVKADMASGACVQIAAHESTIVDAAFSPDGTAIATASIDGECKFFQVYMQSEGEPTCLHRWKPHGGKPVTSLFFLDDHKCVNPEIKFWKYAVTGTDDNCELKLWTCETWKCLQTVRFCSKSSKRHCKLKASVDLSAGYIFVSDMFRKILFVLELEKDNNETVPFVRTATEFKLPCPVLSFAIVEAGPQCIKGNPIYGVEDLTNGEDDENQPSVMVRMYLVQPKSLQECNIVFNTSSPVTQTTSICYEKNGLDEVQNVVEPSITQPSLNLMTPDAFHSPHTSDTTPALSRNGGTPAGDVTVSYSANIVMTNGEPPNDSGGGGERRRGFVSGGSSPSREVEEILSSPRYYTGETAPAKPHSQIRSAEMYEKLRGLETTVQALHSEITTLCHAINVQSTNIQNLQEEVKKNRGTSVSEVEGIIMNAVSTYKPVSEEDIVNTITPMITQAILTVINPAVVKSMTDLQTMVHEEVSSKLSSTDTVLKDNISKIVKSKPFVEMFTRSLSTAVSQAMEPVFRESFTRTVVPMFETACSNMFTQLNETFTKGLNESMKHLNDRANMEIMTLQSASEKISQTAQHFTATVEKETKGLEDTVIEVERRLKACVNGATVRSGTVTPAQHLDPHLIQSQISLLIKQGQYNTAFQQALSASDLSIVSYVCEKVDVNKVFTRCGCVLQQHVLLSLIQQLAADMSSHTDIKQRYLEAAVMNLLPSNENTREHMPQVLSGLKTQLQMFTSSTSDPYLANKAKLLAMACQQMVRNVKEDWVN